MRRRLVAILACCIAGCVNHDAKTAVVKQEVASERDDAGEAEGDQAPLVALAEVAPPANTATATAIASASEGEGEGEAAMAADLNPAADEITDEEIEFAFRQCVHALDSKRPKLTKDVQEHTKKVIGHVTKRMRVAPGFRKLLRLVALREASYQSGLVHRLSPDLQGSTAAWRKMNKRYEGNPFADDPTVWQTYGLFGMNSNYFTMLWDRESDPRVLCDPIVDVVVYRRAAARALRKLNGAIRCRDAKGEPYEFRTTPTWATIHRAVNGGKICPSKRVEQAAIMRKYFKARAGRIGLNPDQRVTAKMLGVEPDKGLDGEAWESQEEMVMGLWEEIEASLESS